MCEKDISLPGNIGNLILDSLSRKINKQKHTTWIIHLAWLVMIGIVITILIGSYARSVWAGSIITECSYYTYASCIKEGTSGITASGEILRDEGEYTAAHPTLPFGTRIRITRLDRQDIPGIVVRVNDRGPAASLRRLGRSIDLNLSAAKALKIVEIGVVQISVEIVGGRYDRKTAHR